MLKKLLITTCVVVLTAPTLALSKDCTKEANAMAIEECHVARYVVSDKALNAVFKAAMASLSGNEKSKFIDAQKAWLKYRDASFAFIVEANKDARSYGNIAIADYKATLVEKRVLEMRFLLAGPEDPPVAW